MGASTLISWTDKTFNPWVGCQSVGPGCLNCYAEASDLRYAPKGSTTAPHFGPGKPRRRTTPANWRQPIKWNEEARRTGTRPFVFCASLADVFDNAVDPQWREDLFELVRKTPHLQWLFLTKRIGNVLRMVNAISPREDVANVWPANAALGITVVTQEEADRDIPKLMTAKASLRPTFVFLSMEPLLERVDIRRWLLPVFDHCPEPSDPPGPGFEDPDNDSCVGCAVETLGRGDCRAVVQPPRIEWVIVGGESGPKARPMPEGAAEDLLEQTEGTATIYHFKQRGGRGADKGGHLLNGKAYRGRPEVPHAHAA